MNPKPGPNPLRSPTRTPLSLPCRQPTPPISPNRPGPGRFLSRKVQRLAPGPLRHSPARPAPTPRSLRPRLPAHPARSQRAPPLTSWARMAASSPPGRNNSAEISGHDPGETTVPSAHAQAPRRSTNRSRASPPPPTYYGRRNPSSAAFAQPRRAKLRRRCGRAALPHLGPPLAAQQHHVRPRNLPEIVFPRSPPPSRRNFTRPRRRSATPTPFTASLLAQTP